MKDKSRKEMDLTTLLFMICVFNNGVFSSYQVFTGLIKVMICLVDQVLYFFNKVWYFQVIIELIY